MPTRGEDYDRRFAELAAAGDYMHGEADLVERLAGNPLARVLDAGCGTGRVAIELASRGFDVVGVDVDSSMLASARAKAPELTWRLVDLAQEVTDAGSFDLVVAAGNVMIFLQLGTEGAVIANLSCSLRPGGLLVAGFQLGRQLPLHRYDELCLRSSLVIEGRFATWQGDPYEGGNYCVSVHRLTPDVVRG